MFYTGLFGCQQDYITVREKKIGSILSKKFNCSRFYYQNQYTKVPVQNVTGDSMKWKVKNKDELNDKYLYPKPFKVKGARCDKYNFG